MPIEPLVVVLVLVLGCAAFILWVLYCLGWVVGKAGGGFLRRHRIGWVATHLHDHAGNDIPYEYGYLFRYRIDLDPRDRVLTLPQMPEILVFAATVER